MSKKEKNILANIADYCAKAEHCIQDVVMKLKQWDVEEGEIERLIQKLLAEKFIDEQRYAKSFVRDKWRFNHWGRMKMANELWKKNIPEHLIALALEEIEEREYRKEINKVLSTKEKALTGSRDQAFVRKISVFAASRGFEEGYVLDWLNSKGIEHQD